MLLATGIGLSESGCSAKHAVPLDTLVVAVEAQPATLDPRFATDANGVRISALIFDGLVRLGADLKPVPEAAERWEVHGHTYTFYLRRDLHFHNGRPLRAEDIDYSFALMLAPSSPFASALDMIKKVTTREMNGQLIVDLEVPQASPQFLVSGLASVKLLPKAEITASGADFANTLIGTGPFRFVRQDLNEIELRAVQAKSEHVLFKVIRDDFTRYQKTMKGEIDIVQMAISADRVADFQKRPREFHVFLYPGLSMSYLLINFKTPLLADRNVRLALAESIERQDFLRYKMHGLGAEATSLLTPENPYFSRSLKNPAFNLADAQTRLMGRVASDTELVLKTSNSPQAVDNGKVLAYQMSRSGVKVAVQSYEWGTFYSDIKHGNFQLAAMRWLGIVDPGIYRLAFHSSEKPPGRNRGSYSNLRLDRLLDAGINLDDEQKRRKIFNEVQEIVNDDIVIIPLWYDQQIAIAKNNVRGYAPNQTGDFRPLTETYKEHE